MYCVFNCSNKYIKIIFEREYMFSGVYYEISKHCNAKCRWCQTGYSNISYNSKSICGSEKSFAEINGIDKAIVHLLSYNMINNDTVIAFFNWGEPTLHPKFREIINSVSKYRLKIDYSTNASIKVMFDQNDDLSCLNTITLSMCGFSQESYNKIHGFNFYRIKQNIEEMIYNCREYGFKGKHVISYHLYQFNIHELNYAIEFAEKNEIFIKPVIAFINDEKRLRQYIKNELEYHELKSMSQDLLLNYTADNLERIPANSKCTQFRDIVIDTDGDIITCCLNSKKYKKVSDVFSVNEINRWRYNSHQCRECIELGINYAVQKYHGAYDLLGNRVMEKYKEGVII